MIIIFEILFFSSLIYYYLHVKTKISIKFMYLDNIFVSLSSGLFLGIINLSNYINVILVPFVVLSFVFILTMIRFWRKPKRLNSAKPNQIVSPADGNIIYIKKIEAGETPIAIKNKTFAKLSELTKSDLIKTPCWLIGINMTPFDVHKNCAPIAGQIVLNQHFNGKYLSLKDGNSIIENERNTYVIKNIENNIEVGVIQIASKRVRRIDSYVNLKDFVKQGQWIGMIRFGSQVDVILPYNAKISLKLGQQVYAIKTIIGEI